jgi:hypothetical protein
MTSNIECLSSGCRVWPVYDGLSQTQIWVRDVSCSVQVCTDLGYATTVAGEFLSISGSDFSASRTDLACHERIYIVDRYSDSLSFVGYELLQLSEVPSMGSSAYSFSVPDSVQIFQDYFGFVFSDTLRDYSLAYVVVSPSSKPFLSAGNCFEQLLAVSSAFCLECTSEESVFPICSVAFFGCVESSGAGDCSVPYSEVDAHRVGSGIGAYSSTFPFEAEYEIGSSLSVFYEQPFFDVPRWCEILSEIGRDSERKLVSFVYSSQMQNVFASNVLIYADAGYSWEIVSYASSAYNGFGFGFLDNSACLFDARDAQLSWQYLSEFSIDMRMQFDIVLDAQRPCFVDAQLQSMVVGLCGFVESIALWQFDFDACKHMISMELHSLYKANHNHGGVMGEFLSAFKNTESLSP